ncbi:methyltransferase RsmF C-terminal domain-like protein [Mucilaginibacter jinjuensis]|uniref:RNA methyltransferase n=1 Tax=Mucilaginibacter jinjuensis TaxID=1176721 RepID=A0ABY7T5P1_9SPHI|nr:RNA methyltransferase [Mucilaginibacter jinjuensis]WCT11651.1 RNA methyltransferase [Mucilaginibacter jinjuensis]
MDNLHFPENFLDDLAQAPGFDRENFVKAHELVAAPTSVRINPNKKTSFINAQPVPWCQDAYYLNERPSFTFDPLFHAGSYYVQEASSMFIDTIMRQIRKNDPEESFKILDLCAAPGGKSTLLASTMTKDDLLVANEIIKTRVPVLTDNLTRWGNANIIVTNNDAKDFARLPGFFDTILIDAPCSGSGMFRKDPAAMDEWSEGNVKLCHQRQERILADVYPALKENGYLIYSTCSYSVEENENILDWLCEAFGMESVRINIDSNWDIVETQSVGHKAWGYRFYPDKVKGEGLFASCLIKRQEAPKASTHKNKFQKLNAKEIDPLRPYIKDSENYHFFKVADDWMVIPDIHRDSMLALQDKLYIKKSGVRIGKLAGRDLIPDHELALSLIINKDEFQETELTEDQAIAYLRRDNIDMEITQKGWSLMTYKGEPLGWAKLLPNRINNYYPKELRIMSTLEARDKKQETR